VRRLSLAQQLVLVVALAAASVAGLGTDAAGSIAAPNPITALNPDIPPEPPRKRESKVDSRVRAVIEATARGEAHGLQFAREHGFASAGRKVRVLVTSAGGLTAARDAVVSVGGHIDAEYADVVQAFVPVAALRRLADLPTVTRVSTPLVAVPDAVIDEGVAATNASAWQSAGWTGAGVKVGVIDGGFVGYTERQASGDLPSTLLTADFGCGGVATLTNHGTAVAEIVHKMAPGAQLYLICISTSVNLGQAKDYAIKSRGWEWRRSDSRGDRQKCASQRYSLGQLRRQLWDSTLERQFRRHRYRRSTEHGSAARLQLR
jgi:hypothetical protein